MDFLRTHRFIGWLAIIVGGVLAAGSCFDKGITDLDDTRLTTKVCSDYPVGEAPADCLTTRDVLDTDRAINHPVLFVVGMLLLAAGLAIVTGVGPFEAKTTTTKNPGAYP